MICGDGDLMEGVSAEAASLAGHLQLGKLIMMYDSNNITLDGEAHLSFSEDVGKRFEAYGWQVLQVNSQNDLHAIERALVEAKNELTKPTLIEVKTTLGYGSPNKGGKGGHQGTHGSPLGAEEVKLTKEFYQWPQEDFYIPEEVKAYYQEVKRKGDPIQPAMGTVIGAVQARISRACSPFRAGYTRGITFRMGRECAEL
ncbi:hypothetical protein GCM10020331_079450 [Ectobacillus funiculus]